MDIPKKIQFCSLTELQEKIFITKWVEEWRDEISAIFVKEYNDIVVVSTVCPHFLGGNGTSSKPIKVAMQMASLVF